MCGCERQRTGDVKHQERGSALALRLFHGGPALIANEIERTCEQRPRDSLHHDS